MKSASPYPSSADERIRGGSSGTKRKKTGGAAFSFGVGTPRDSPAFGDSSDDDGDDDADGVISDSPAGALDRGRYHDDVADDDVDVDNPR